MPVDLIRKSLLAGLGGGLAALCLLWWSSLSAYPLIMAPFGASCVILFALPESPLGLLALHFLPPSIWATALAVGVGIAAMVVTKTTHPPAGANPLLILLAGKSFAWSFLLFPVGIGALLLVVMAAAFHAAVRQLKYPASQLKKTN